MKIKKIKIMETIYRYILPLGLKKAVYTALAVFIFALLDLEFFSLLAFLLAKSLSIPLYFKVLCFAPLLKQKRFFTNFKEVQE